jgi:hypothetical protein
MEELQEEIKGKEAVQEALKVSFENVGSHPLENDSGFRW